MKFTDILRAWAASVTILGGTIASADSHGPILVTSTADSGAGSLRAALSQTTGAPIIIATAEGISIDNTLVYAGTAPLIITGTGQDILNTANTDILAVTQGANVSITGLNLVGPAGFSITERTVGQAGKGLFIDLREDQRDTVVITLVDVTVRDVAGHGVHISDCDIADDCGSGGSDASIEVNLHAVTIKDVGHGRHDADGLRVDERGNGSINATFTESWFINVGADGVELDEGQDGHVFATLSQTTFARNGNYCDPNVLTAFLPSPAEAEFEKGTTNEDAIPAAITTSPDDQCIEREVEFYDDGSVQAYEFSLDLDDGLDIDEAGPGSIISNLHGVEIYQNRDEGLDFDEEDAGALSMYFVGAEIDNNTDDGIKLSESGPGNLGVVAIKLDAHSNGGTGFVFEEEGDGNVRVSMLDVTSNLNDDGDDTGIEIVQDDAGEGTALFVTSVFNDGTDIEGVDVTRH